jgi:hypothetical protein
MSDFRLNHYIPASGPEGINKVKIGVYYSKGGINFFNYQNEPSAIWASLTPMEVKHENGFKCEKYGMGKGLKVNLEPATRLNRKNVEAAFQRVVAEITMGTGRVWDALQQVCVKEGVTLQTNLPLPTEQKA